MKSACVHLPGTDDVVRRKHNAESCRSEPLSLADAVVGEIFIVSHVVAPPGAPQWAHQLEDIGFIAGERVVLMARGLPGGDPLVVRVGLSTFALRLAEAACVRLTLPDTATA
jgi:ferrous iron transport protein A